MKFKSLNTFGLLIASCALLSGCGPRGSAEELYQKGTKDLSSGDQKSAYRNFQAAVKKNPDEIKYLWAASSAAPNNNMAQVHTKSAWDKGFKTPAVMMRLAALSFHTDQKQKLDYALSLYEEMADSLKSDEMKGDLFYNFGQLDSALKYWDIVAYQKETPEIINKIALALEKQGRIESMITHLEKNRLKKLLNSQGYSMLMSLRALQYRYGAVDTLYNEADQFGISDDFLKVEYAGLLFAQGKFALSGDVLEGVYSENEPKSAHKIRARMLKGYELFLLRDSLALWNLLETSDTTLFKAAEKRFYSFLFDRMRDKKDGIEVLRAIRRESPPSAWIDLALGREYGHQKRFAQADTFYRLVPPAIRFSPNVLEEFALVQMRLGRDDDALALLSRLHTNRIVTRTSLEMFRDLTFKNKLIDKSKAAQKLLESRYKDDVKVQWSGAVMALKTGQVDSALAQFTRLAKAYPDEERFEVMRLTVLHLKGEYAKVIEQSSAGKLPVQMAKLLQARAYRKLGQNDNARAAYTEALKSDKENMELSVEYTDFLTQIEDYSTAAGFYSGIIDRFKAGSAQDSAALAGLLNNYAWTAALSEGSDSKLVLKAVEQANRLLPENKDIMDTYAVVLNKYGKYKDCIKLLSESSVVGKNPDLKVHLGKAYEKINDINMAVRLYQEAIALSDSSKVKLSTDREELKSHIQAIMPQE